MDVGAGPPDIGAVPDRRAPTAGHGRESDAELTTGLGVVLGAVLATGLDHVAADLDGLVDLEEVVQADLSSVLEVEPALVAPLVGPLLAALTALEVDRVAAVDPTALVTPRILVAAQQLPDAQRARLAELARAQYGLCEFGHPRAVRIVNSGRYARTEIWCRLCPPDSD